MDAEKTSITGVLVTGKTTARYGLARRAVDAWVAQDYPGPRQLLIINDHAVMPLLKPAQMAPNVFEARVSETGSSLGHLRNIGNYLAQGDYIVQWDDDDYSPPDRLRYQVENTDPGAMSIFRYEIHCDLPKRQGFVNDGRSIRCHGFPGTMLFPRGKPCDFPDKGKAEDTEFVLAMKNHCDLQVLQNKPRMYVRFYHGANTWSQQHVMMRKPGARNLRRKERAYLQDVLDKYQNAAWLV